MIGKKSLYQGRVVTILRPAAPGDPGFDASKDDLVLIRYDEAHETGHETPEKVVHRDEVQPL